jgi:excisionase family DNA binding protein
MMMITERELAERLKVHIQTVRNMRKRGLPFYRVGGWLIRYKVDEVDAWLASQRRELKLGIAGGRR